MVDYQCPQCQFPVNSSIPALPTSPLSNVSLSNGTTVDKDAIRSTITKTCTNIAALETLISSLESTLDACRESLEQHLDFVAEHKAALGIKRIPAELLGEVFCWARVGQDKDDKVVFRSATPNSAPLVLTQVSRTWREIAIHTPLLWANIDFHISLNVPPSKMRLLNMWLTRSATAELHVSFVMAETVLAYLAQSTDKNAINSLLMVAGHQCRWGKIKLQIPSEMYRADPFPLRHTTSLKSASFHTTNLVQEKLNNTVIEQCPDGLKLEIRNFTHEFSRQSALVPWASVKSLGLDLFVNPKDFANILELLPSLDYLFVAINENPITLETVHHAKMRDLRLVCNSSQILARLDLPNLQYLKIYDMTSVTVDNMITFFKRTPALAHLTLDQCDSSLSMDPRLESSISQLHLLHAVKASELDLIQSSLAALRKFRYKSQSLEIFPSLKYLSLRIDFLTSMDSVPTLITELQNVFIDIWRDRVDPRSALGGLQTLTLRVEDELSDFYIDVLSQMREMGLDGLYVEIGPRHGRAV